MPSKPRNLLNLTIAGTLAAFLSALVLLALFLRLGDEPAALWTTRAAYLFGILLVIALATSHFSFDAIVGRRENAPFNNDTGTPES